MKNYVIDNEATNAFHDAMYIESLEGIALIVKSLKPDDFIGMPGNINTSWYAAFDCLCSPRNHGYNWKADKVWRLQ